jgi:hypothetical protein
LKSEVYEEFYITLCKNKEKVKLFPEPKVEVCIIEEEGTQDNSSVPFGSPTEQNRPVGN